MTELEKKAENYAKSEFPNDEFKQQIVIKSLLYGYEQGQEHGLLMHLNVIADDYKKENEELKKSTTEKNSEVKELKTLADNRQLFIDWVFEHYPDIAKEYLNK